LAHPAESVRASKRDEQQDGKDVLMPGQPTNAIWYFNQALAHDDFLLMNFFAGTSVAGSKNRSSIPISFAANTTKCIQDRLAL
jgi:hypothetical protein